VHHALGQTRQIARAAIQRALLINIGHLTLQLRNAYVPMVTSKLAALISAEVNDYDP
jgi:hypothetical protein